jgi:hypothetical protein
MGLVPVNFRKVMTACIQSVTMFGSELWWKGDRVEGTIGRAEELQTLVNKQARAVTGCFQTTNLGALCRNRRSCIDAVAVLMNCTQRAWQWKEIAGALFMDVKSAFNNVSKTHLGKRMEPLGLESDHIR